MKAFESQHTYIPILLKIVTFTGLHALPVSPFALFSWHNAQARSVTSQCSGVSFIFARSSSSSAAHLLGKKREIQTEGEYSMCYTLLLLITSSELARLWQFLGLVMRFSHFSTFDQYANFCRCCFFLLYAKIERLFSLSMLLPIFRYAALCVAVRFSSFEFSDSTNRLDSERVLYSIAWGPNGRKRQYHSCTHT